MRPELSIYLVSQWFIFGVFVMVILRMRGWVPNPKEWSAIFVACLVGVITNLLQGEASVLYQYLLSAAFAAVFRQLTIHQESHIWIYSARVFILVTTAGAIVCAAQKVHSGYDNMPWFATWVAMGLLGYCIDNHFARLRQLRAQLAALS